MWPRDMGSVSDAIRGLQKYDFIVPVPHDKSQTRLSKDKKKIMRKNLVDVFILMERGRVVPVDETSESTALEDVRMSTPISTNRSEQEITEST